MVPPHPWFDQGQAPVYRINFPIDTAETVESFPAFLQTHRAFWRTIDQRVALITDVTRILTAPPTVRKAMADADLALRAEQTQYLAAWAVVVATPLQRLILQAYLWLAPPAFPYAIFSDSNTAMAWARERLAAEGHETHSLVRLRAAAHQAEMVSQRLKR